MKMLLTYLFTFCAINLMAQDKQPKRQYIKMNLGYGTENNWGNTAFVFGAGYERSYSKKFSLSGDLDYFTTGIYNVYLNRPTSVVPNLERYYKAIFFSGKASYNVLGNQSKFNVSLSAGPTILYRNAKHLQSYSFRGYQDGRTEIIPESVKYKSEKGVRLAYNAGIDFNAPFQNGYVFSIGLDTYSIQIPIEFFIPSFTLKKPL